MNSTGLAQFARAETPVRHGVRVFPFVVANPELSKDDARREGARAARILHSMLTAHMMNEANIMAAWAAMNQSGMEIKYALKEEFIKYFGHERTEARCARLMQVRTELVRTLELNRAHKVAGFSEADERAHAAETAAEDELNVRLRREAMAAMANYMMGAGAPPTVNPAAAAKAEPAPAKKKKNKNKKKKKPVEPEDTKPSVVKRLVDTGEGFVAVNQAADKTERAFFAELKQEIAKDEAGRGGSVAVDGAVGSNPDGAGADVVLS